jgi:hypothetical protein
MEDVELRLELLRLAGQLGYGSPVEGAEEMYRFATGQETTESPTRASKTDFLVETFRSGFKRKVRIVHLPSGVAAVGDTRKAAIENLAEAIKKSSSNL